MASIIQPDNKQLIYLYDLPKSLVTSVKIATVLKNQAGYDLQEPVQFRDAKPHPLTGLQSPFQYGIIKVDANKFAEIAKAIKYFDIEDGTDANGQPRVWHCRALPFDRELLGANKTSTNSQLNVFVKGLKPEVAAKTLDETFSEKFGEVKSAKVSQSVINKSDASAPPISNGYGFVCFQRPESLQKAVEAKQVDGIEIIRYQPKDNREVRKVYNNVYVKNFNPSWNEAKLREIFSKYGDIKSLVVMTKKGKDGEEKPFAFVCYEHADNKLYGPECADKAVSDLNEKEVDGYKLYVQPALPKDQRIAQVQREQMRFKNSKKKCNLFVKGFPASFTEENLRELFAQFGEIESIKIIQSKEENGAKSYGSRAFVCYKQPDSAASARARLHSQLIDGKPLYVTNYELPEIRRKQQIEAKDRADFMTQRKNTAAPLDAALLTRPDTIQLIQQILMLIQRQMGGRFPGQQPFGPRGQQRQFNQRPGFQNRPPQGAPRQQYAQQQPINQVPQPIPQQVPAAAAQGTQFTIKGDLQPLAHPDPFVNAYNQKGFTLLPVVVPGNPNLKQFVGEFIYEYVEKFVGEEKAPKITGMLIDLPLEEIKGYLYDFTKLQQKVYEAVQILQQLSQQQQ